MTALPLPILVQRISHEFAVQRPEFRERVLHWAIDAAARNGIAAETVLGLLDGKSPERHWWHVRQLLPESEIFCLYCEIVAEFGPIPTKIEEEDEDEWIEIS